jgi:hypothetical protein
MPWTAIPTKVSTVNKATLTNGTNTASYAAHNGTAQAGAATTITLQSGASGSDDFYNTMIVEIADGAGKGQTREVTDYVGSTLVATVGAAWDVAPDSSSVYAVHQQSGICPIQSQANSHTSLLLKATAPAVAGFYTNCFIKIIGGHGRGQRALITSYSAGRVATINSTWHPRPDSTTFYVIYGEGGTGAAGSDATKIVLDGNQSAIAGTQYLRVEIMGGTGIGQIRTVSSLSTNDLSVSPNWTTAPDTTSVYTIYGGWGGEFEASHKYASTRVVALIGSDEHAILDAQHGLNDTTGAVFIGRQVETSGTYSPSHTLDNRSDYFRLRVIGQGTPLNGTVQSILHAMQAPAQTTSIHEEIHDSHDCSLVRAVITGRNQFGYNEYENCTTDARGNLNVRIQGPLASYGEILQASNVPVMQMKYTYNVEPQLVQVDADPATVVSMGTEGESGVAQVQTITLPPADSFVSDAAANYFTLENGAGSPASFYVWYSIGTSSDPSPGGTGIQATITAGQTSTQVATATQTAVDGNASFSATSSNNQCTITNAGTAATDPVSIAAAGMPSTSLSTGTTVKGSSLLSATCGAGVNSKVCVFTRKPLRYRPGQGASCKFTAIFDTPSDNTAQWAGVGNMVSGYFVGYNTSSQFGFLRRTGGMVPVNTLTVTTAVSTTSDITVTVDGLDFVMNAADTLSTTSKLAAFIAGQDYTTANFNAEQFGSSVKFVGTRLTVGTNGWAFAAGSSGSAAAFPGSMTTVGVAVTDNFTPQTEWNGDRGDLKGNSRVMLQPDKGIVYQINWQWHGFGGITLSMNIPERPRQFIQLHEVEYPNRFTVPSITAPDVSLMAIAESTTGAVSKTVKSASASLFNEGNIRSFGPHFATTNRHDDVDDNQTNNVILRIRNPCVYNDIASQVDGQVRLLALATSGSSSSTKGTVVASLVVGGTESGGTTELAEVGNGSAFLVAKPSYADGITLSTLGTTIFTTTMGPNSSNTLDLNDYNLHIHNGQNMYVVYSSSPVSGSNTIDFTACVNWAEQA